MERVNLESMEDVTFRDISYEEFLSRYEGFIARTEVQGVDVCLYRNEKECSYLLVVFVDGKKLHSEIFPDVYMEAYAAYVRQVHFVRKFYTQGWRKEIFYYKNPDEEDSSLSVIFP